MTNYSTPTADEPWRAADVVPVGSGCYEHAEAVVARIAEVSGFTPGSPTSIRGHVSRRGIYRREGPNGERSIVTGNPLMDAIASPVGEVLIGGNVVLPPTVGPTRPRATVCMPGPHDDLETCYSEDGSRIDIKSSDGSYVTFHSWRETGLTWTVGTSITARGPHFQRAAIDSRYYFPALAQICTVIYDNDHDANDSYMAESESGFGSDSAHRVESLCRVQWNGYRLRGVVSAGEPCFTGVTIEPFPSDFPADWPAIDPPPSVTVSPTRLEFAPRSTNPILTKRVNVTSTFDHAIEITVSAATLDRGPQDLLQQENPFSNVFGRFTIPPRGRADLGVTFDGSVISAGAATALQFYRGRFSIESDAGRDTVILEGRIEDVFAPL